MFFNDQQDECAGMKLESRLEVLLRKITESGSVNKAVFTFCGSMLKET